MTILYACLLFGGYVDPVVNAIAVDYGLALLPVPTILVLAAYIMRQRAGAMMLAGGHTREAIVYCEPRALPSLSVGRAEAARNRLTAARALLALDNPIRALVVIDEGSMAVGSAELRALLTITRAEALAALGRCDEIGSEGQLLGKARTSRRIADALARLAERRAGPRRSTPGIHTPKESKP